MWGGNLDVGEHQWEFGAMHGSVGLLTPFPGEMGCSSNSEECLHPFLRVLKNLQPILFSSLNGYNPILTKAPVGVDSEVASQVKT